MNQSRLFVNLLLFPYESRNIEFTDDSVEVLMQLFKTESGTEAYKSLPSEIKNKAVIWTAALKNGVINNDTLPESPAIDNESDVLLIIDALKSSALSMIPEGTVASVEGAMHALSVDYKYYSVLSDEMKHNFDVAFSAFKANRSVAEYFDENTNALVAEFEDRIKHPYKYLSYEQKCDPEQIKKLLFWDDTVIDEVPAEAFGNEALAIILIDFDSERFLKCEKMREECELENQDKARRRKLAMERMEAVKEVGEAENKEEDAKGEDIWEAFDDEKETEHERLEDIEEDETPIICERYIYARRIASEAKFSSSVLRHLIENGHNPFEFYTAEELSTMADKLYPYFATIIKSQGYYPIPFDNTDSQAKALFMAYEDPTLLETLDRSFFDTYFVMSLSGASEAAAESMPNAAFDNPETASAFLHRFKTQYKLPETVFFNKEVLERIKDNNPQDVIPEHLFGNAEYMNLLLEFMPSAIVHTALIGDKNFFEMYKNVIADNIRVFDKALLTKHFDLFSSLVLERQELWDGSFFKTVEWVLFALKNDIITYAQIHGFSRNNREIILLASEKMQPVHCENLSDENLKDEPFLQAVMKAWGDEEHQAYYQRLKDMKREARVEKLNSIIDNIKQKWGWYVLGAGGATLLVMAIYGAISETIEQSSKDKVRTEEYLAYKKAQEAITSPERLAFALREGRVKNKEELEKYLSDFGPEDANKVFFIRAQLYGGYDTTAENLGYEEDIQKSCEYAIKSLESSKTALRMAAYRVENICLSDEHKEKSSKEQKERANAALGADYDKIEQGDSLFISK